MGPCAEIAINFLLLSLLLNFQSFAVLGESEKYAIKTFKIGEEKFDCVDIYSQPAFKNPLLKNHTIQMRPSSYPEVINDEPPHTTNYSSIEMNGEECPYGTVPIWRSPKDSLSLKSFTNFLSDFASDTYNKSSEESTKRQHWAIMRLSQEAYGARAVLNVYEPKLKGQDQITGSAMQIMGGQGNNRNYILGVWFVAPQFGSENYASFHVGWFSAKNNVLCLNLGQDERCHGFVHVNRALALGARIEPVSTYGGDQYAIHLLIYKDRETGHWWVVYGDDLKPLGYWPESLFTGLKNVASLLKWGGRVFSPRGEESPPMGSGHFPLEGFGKAAFVRNILHVDKGRHLVLPIFIKLDTRYSNYACYRIDRLMYNGEGITFYYGGPGGCKE